MSSEQLQGFFESTTGQIATIIVIFLLFIGILITNKNKKLNTKVMATSALLVTLSIGLNQIVLFPMPQGGDVTAFCMLPIVLCSYMFGVRRGVMAGMCVGLLNLIFNPYVIHPLQLFLDYPMAFGALGFAALMKRKGSSNIIPCYILGVLCRYICAVLSGIIFFGEYAQEGFNSVTWSLYYNITYLGVEGIITIIILSIPSVKHALYKLSTNYNQEQITY